MNTEYTLTPDMFRYPMYGEILKWIKEHDARWFQITSLEFKSEEDKLAFLIKFGHVKSEYEGYERV